MDRVQGVHPAFGDAPAAAAVLQVWQELGEQAAVRHQQSLLAGRPELRGDRLQRELFLRLAGRPGPRLLVDGVWFCRPHGGIARVWEQILGTWRLPGMLTPAAPACLIERNSHLAVAAALPALDGCVVDPLNPSSVASLAEENAALSRQWQADVFVSSWISSAGAKQAACPELALVHDCLPERFGVSQPLASLRRRWLTGARGYLAVSADTAADLEGLLTLPPRSVGWCHSAPAGSFVCSPSADHAGQRLWRGLQRRAGLCQPYVLLPATSAIGSYKNPEVVVEALACPRLHHVQLVLCGIGADQRRQQLEERYPHLQERCVAAGFTDLELALAYRHALAVVIPSHAEGFGLPAIEALATGATVVLADSRGLREAGGGAAMRFNPRRPAELARLLELLLDPGSAWLFPHLQRRRQQRLDGLHPHLLGLALLAQARLTVQRRPQSRLAAV